MLGDVGGARALSNREAGVVELETVFLHVTRSCNLQCAYCYSFGGEGLPDELRTDEFRRLWPDLVEVAPRRVIFTGGEPLLRADLFDLLADLRAADRDHSIQLCLNTNGYLVTREVARRLTGLVDEVRVSVDGLAARNDALRGAGSFDAAMRALGHLSLEGHEPKVLVTLTSHTLPDFDALVSVLLGKGFTRINMSVFRPIGRGAGLSHLEVTSEAAFAAFSRASARASAMPAPAPAPPGHPERQARSTCGVGRFVNVMPDGDVFPCHALTQPEFRCGNVRERSLIEICDRRGVLGRLSTLDFISLASEEGRIEEITRPCACLGHVYTSTAQLAVWRRRVLPAAD